MPMAHNSRCRDMISRPMRDSIKKGKTAQDDAIESVRDDGDGPAIGTMQLA